MWESTNTVSYFRSGPLGMIGAPFKEASTVGFSTIQGEEFYER